METATIRPMVNQVELHPGLSQVPLQNYLISQGIQIESYGPLMKGGVFEGIWQEGLSKIAEKHNATIPQIIIAWGLARNVIMIPKSVTQSRIADNSPWGPYTE